MEITPIYENKGGLHGLLKINAKYPVQSKGLKHPCQKWPKINNGQQTDGMSVYYTRDAMSKKNKTPRLSLYYFSVSLNNIKELILQRKRNNRKTVFSKSECKGNDKKTNNKTFQKKNEKNNRDFSKTTKQNKEKNKTHYYIYKRKMKKENEKNNKNKNNNGIQGGK